MKAVASMPAPVRMQKMLLWYAINDPSKIERSELNRRAFIEALRDHAADLAKLIAIVAKGPNKNEHLEDWLLARPELTAPDFFHGLTAESFDARTRDEKAPTVSASPEALRRAYNQAHEGRKASYGAVRKAIARIHFANGGTDKDEDISD